MLVYIDDLLITGLHNKLIQQQKETMMGHFSLKKGTVINQRKYSLDCIEYARLLDAKPSLPPTEQNLILTSYDFDMQFHADSLSLDPLLDNVEPYKRLVGRLIYLTVTQQDISLSVQRLSQFIHQPKKSHLVVALTVNQYIKLHQGQRIFFHINNQLPLSIYCDSDWASCPITR